MILKKINFLRLGLTLYLIAILSVNHLFIIVIVNRATVPAILKHQ